MKHYVYHYHVVNSQGEQDLHTDGIVRTAQPIVSMDAYRAIKDEIIRKMRPDGDPRGFVLDSLTLLHEVDSLTGALW